MERILLKIEYDGTNYCGWQRQIKDRSIQQVMEEAIYRVQGEKTVLQASGRTDSGVHALCQMAHFDSSISLDAEKWCMVLNDILPQDIRILCSKGVSADFHARYQVKDKTYQYIIYNHRINTALKRGYSYFVPYKLDIQRMRRSLAAIVGRYDFAAFMSARSQKENTVREIYEAHLEQKGRYLNLYVRGNGFLHNMVRIIAGTLVDIGRGRLCDSAFDSALKTKDRNCLGITAKAHGLYLYDVSYYDSIEQKYKNRLADY